MIGSGIAPQAIMLILFLVDDPPGGVFLAELAGKVLLGGVCGDLEVLVHEQVLNEIGFAD